jgi:hypothetical protein
MEDTSKRRGEATRLIALTSFVLHLNPSKTAAPGVTPGGREK